MALHSMDIPSLSTTSRSDPILQMQLGGRPIRPKADCCLPTRWEFWMPSSQLTAHTQWGSTAFILPQPLQDTKMTTMCCGICCFWIPGTSAPLPTSTSQDLLSPQLQRMFGNPIYNRSLLPTSTPRNASPSSRTASSWIPFTANFPQPLQQFKMSSICGSSTSQCHHINIGYSKRFLLQGYLSLKIFIYIENY